MFSKNECFNKIEARWITSGGGIKQLSTVMMAVSTCLCTTGKGCSPVLNLLGSWLWWKPSKGLFIDEILFSFASVKARLRPYPIFNTRGMAKKIGKGTWKARWEL